MRAALAVLLLGGCATPRAVVLAPAPALPPPPPAPVECPRAAVPYSEAGSALGARVEKVCLVGASEDSYLRLHEVVAPREGAVLDAEAVRADVEALFEQGLLRDVVVVAQPLPSKGVMLSYLVSEYEWVSRVAFTGAAAVKQEDLRAVVHAGVRASPFVLRALGDQVKALYEGLGYPNTRVATVVKSLGDGNATLTLEIEEGLQVRVGAVSFAGAQQLGEAELRKPLRSLVGAPFLKDLVERDTLLLTSLYFDHGMVNVTVTSTTRPLVGGAPGAVELIFQVKEGDVYRMGKLSLTGFPVGPEKDLLKGMEAKPRSVFSRSALQRDMERLRTRARQKGYTVEVTPLTTVDPDKKTIDVAFELEKRVNPDIQF